MVIEELRLGQNGCRADALHKIHSWAPSRARSYTIDSIERYEYGVFRDKPRRCYFKVHVRYFSGMDEGAYRLDRRGWSWLKHCCQRIRFPVLRTRRDTGKRRSGHALVRRIVMGESTVDPDQWRNGEKVEP